jgi:hypothetical protein
MNADGAKIEDLRTLKNAKPSAGSCRRGRCLIPLKVTRIEVTQVIGVSREAEPGTAMRADVFRDVPTLTR